MILLLLLLQYVPPIGIPAPPFGINETLDDSTFTHWVDNSGACSDAGNGTPGNPRCTLPNSLTAGDKVQIRGGPYLVGTTTFTLTANGTSANPIWFRGPASPAARPALRPSNFDIASGSDYLIIENIFLDGVRHRHSGPVDHVVLRNSEHKGRVGVNCTQGSGTFLVWHNVHIHDCGTVSPCDDRHGITLASTSTDVWVLDSEINNANGDGIQFCHACAEPGPTRIYIGGNKIHNNAENGVDLKTSKDVVISQNELYGHAEINQGSCSSDGVSILIGSNGLADEAVNIWAIFNNIHDNDAGIRIEAASNGSGARGPAYIVGNIIRDTLHAAVRFDKDGGPIYVVNNTVENTDHFLNVTFRTNFDLAVFDNVVVGMAGLDYAGDDVMVEYNEVSSISDMDRNVFYQDGASVHIQWGATQYDYALSANMSGFPGGASNKHEDPLFVNRTTHDFNLQSGSPAIGMGAESSVYATYQSLFGESIKFDYAGRARPQGGTWDAGAFEFDAAEPPLQVDTTSFPDATVGVAYGQCATASNGTPPYSWSVFSGSVPTGLTFGSNGCFSGSPTAAGDFNFVIRVTDNVSATDDSGSLSIHVNAAPAPQTPGKLTVQVVGNVLLR